MTYYLYHIPGKKIGVTRNLEERVHKQQGYHEGEYVILAESFFSKNESSFINAFIEKIYKIIKDEKFH